MLSLSKSAAAASASEIAGMKPYCDKQPMRKPTFLARQTIWTLSNVMSVPTAIAMQKITSSVMMVRALSGGAVQAGRPSVPQVVVQLTGNCDDGPQ